MSTLTEHPVLFLAIDNLSKMSSIDEKQLSTIWNLFTKCKDNLENGRRLENISWRLWYRSTHFPVPDLEKNSTQMSTSFSKVLSAPFPKEKSHKENLPLPIIESLEPLESLETLQTCNPLNQTTASHSLSINRTLENNQALLEAVTESFMLNEKELLEEVVDQEMMMDQESEKEIYSCPGNLQRKATFFVSDSCSVESHTIEMKRDIQREEEETDYDQYDEDDDGFSYSTDWSWTPSPLFSKIPLTELKEPVLITATTHKKSQLSCALNTKDHIREVSEESERMHLSSSMKQTLIWDRCMPFNTRYAKDRPIKEDWRSEDTAEYW